MSRKYQKGYTLLRAVRSRLERENLLRTRDETKRNKGDYKRLNEECKTVIRTAIRRKERDFKRKISYISKKKNDNIEKGNKNTKRNG